MPRREAGGQTESNSLRRRRAVARVGLFAIALGYLGLAFVSLYRPNPGDGMGSLEAALTWASLMGATFLPHAGVALMVGLVACVLLRARKTALVGVPLLALSLGPWLLSFGPARTDDAARSDGDSLLVLSANLLGVSRSDIDLLGQIETHEPDVIMLQEVRGASLERLVEALGDTYEHVAAPRESNFGVAVFSRLAFKRDARVLHPSSGADLPQLIAWVDWGGEELCVWDVHLLPPTGRGPVAGQARMAWEMGDVLDELLGEGRPMIVAGDFNSPWRGQPLDGLRERGFVEAHREAGRGPGSSWPARGLLSLPPGIRIDHVAYTPGLTCVEAWVGEATASDHRPNFARFARADRSREGDLAEGDVSSDGP